MTRPALVLASTSPYRRELLQRLRLPFEVLAPAVDETPRPGEAPADLACRLALAKARSGAALRPQAVVIGADQVAALDRQPLGKPGHHAAARAQLLRMSGREVVFHTAVAVASPQAPTPQLRLVDVRVQMRSLDEAQVERYLALEQPYDCAGSARSEGLGICLLQAVHSDDPTALVGLPLIATAQLLRAAGLDPLA